MNKAENAAAIPESPYVGLSSYSPRDADFFFGRETETEIISANLRSARLTVLYGTSGVGKSSVLQAGVVHSLREIARQDAETYGQAEFAVVVQRNWAGDPLEGVAEAVRAAVAESLGVDAGMLEPVPEKKDLTKILQAWTERYGLELLIILDQFEELFNYLSSGVNPCASFAKQLPQAVNATDLSARFLISLRGDTLSLLDYYKDDVHGLFDNRLQIHHLNEENARRAITEPINAYNKLYKPAVKFDIQPSLVDEVIEQVKIGQAEQTVAEPGALTAPAGDAAKLSSVKDAEQIFVETPLLQLVMKRLWREETQVGSNILRFETLERLKGTKQIIQTHLDGVMETLTEEEKQIASKCFKYLVTPMGTKIAFTPAALARYTGWDERGIKDVLEILIEGKENAAGKLDVAAPVLEQKAAIDARQKEKPRILRAVEITVGNKKNPGYEVTHDALIPAIQDWRARYIIEHNSFNRVKATALKYLPFAAAVVILFASMLLISFWRWQVNSDLATVAEHNSNKLAAAVNVLKTNENSLQQELVNKETAANDSYDLAQISQNAEKRAKEDKNANYKTLCKILIDLSNGSATDKEIAIKNLKLQIGQGQVPKEYENSLIQLVAKIDAQKAADLRIAAYNQSQQNNSQQISPRVYIQIADDDQRASAQQYRKLLSDNNFSAPGIETVSNAKLSSTQIRYFRQDDTTLADQVTELLKNNGFTGNIRPQYIPGYEDSTAIRPKHLELWFAADAFTGGVNSAKQ